MFNEVKMTYKNSVEKSELLLDSFYLRYENDDSFQSVRDDDDDQSVRVRDENSDSENSNHQEEILIEIISSAESLTEVQSVRRNLISSSADSSQSVKVDQIASLHAAGNTLVVSANQDDDDEHTNDQFVLISDSKSTEQEESNEMTNQQDADNRLISEKNNSLILNYSRSKIRHDYKQLHHRDFVKAAKKIESIESIAEHDLIISKTFEQIINDPQAKE
jgi:hypothetical protein